MNTVIAFCVMAVFSYKANKMLQNTCRRTGPYNLQSLFFFKTISLLINKSKDLYGFVGFATKKNGQKDFMAKRRFFIC